MPRAFTPKVITANDLLEGDVIYYTADNSWTREMSRGGADRPMRPKPSCA